jgi:cytochrome c biogenesis protein
MRLGIAVMVVVAVLSLLGAMIPQGAGADYYGRVYGPVWSRVILALGLDHVFSADYFTAFLIALCVMVFACSLKTLPARIRLARGGAFIRSKDGIRRLPFAGEVAVGLDPEETGLHIEDIARRRLYGVRRGPEGTFMASRGGFSRYGSFLLHVSFIFLLAGGVSMTRLGWRYLTEVPVGESFVLKASRSDEVTVRVDDFTRETDGRGMLQDYVCRVTLSREGRSLFRYRIRPNHPLEFEGREVFLVSYAEDPDRPEGFIVAVYDSSGGLIRPHLFVPTEGEAYLEELGGAVTAVTGFAPGVRLFRESGSAETYILKDSPPPEGAAPGRPTFVGVHTVPSTIVTLEVVNEPGQLLVIAGLVMLTAGTFIGLYLSHRRMWFIVEQCRDGGSRVLFGGRSNRNPEGMKREMDAVRRQLDELA